MSLKNNPLTKLLAIDYPIIQAPMVGVSTPELAAAVSNAGALGSIGIGASSVAQAREMITQTRALTGKPFNVNVFCHAAAKPSLEKEARWLEHLTPAFQSFNVAPPKALSIPYQSFNEDRAMLDMLLSEKSAVVSFHFGLPPKQWIDELKQQGIKTLACATTLQEACLVEAAGIDAVVVQGVEAGGHRGVFEPEKGDLELGVVPLTRLVSAECNIPVIAAGGIMDGQGIQSVMTLGASGAQLGTAFILAQESAANAYYRSLMKSERSLKTRITSAISGRPARGLYNRFQDEVDSPNAPSIPDYPIAYDAGKALAKAASANNDHEFSPLWAGQGAPLAREMSAQHLIEILLKESGFC